MTLCKAQQIVGAVAISSGLEVLPSVVTSHYNLRVTPVHKGVEAITTTLDPTDGVVFGQLPTALIADVIDSLVRIKVPASLVDASHLKTAHCRTSRRTDWLNTPSIARANNKRTRVSPKNVAKLVQERDLLWKAVDNPLCDVDLTPGISVGNLRGRLVMASRQN